MKRNTFGSGLLLYALLAALLCAALAVGAAADASGLDVFSDVRTYAPGQFDDVARGAWYESAVRTMFQKGIMEGVGEDFLPYKTMSWAEAATITARLHAAYHGKEIPTTEGAWYQRYLDYDAANGLLPASCPDAAAARTAEIRREDLCLLIRGVLSEADLPVINDAAAPDLDDADPAARDAVRDMYAAGIFTGKEGGRFQPKAAATRAEIATVVTRLLCPAQRISADSRVSAVMADQYGNFLNKGVAVRLDGVSYYILQSNQRVREEVSTLWEIVARPDDGLCRTVYAAEKNVQIERLSAGDDGKLYFTERIKPNGVWQYQLLGLDPASGKTETLYSSKGIGGYLFYDGQLYLLDQDTSNQNPDRWVYRIGRVSNGRFTQLGSAMDRSEALYTDDSMYCFGGRLYYFYGDSTYTYGDGKYTGHYYSLWAIDLKTGENRRVIDGAAPDTISGGHIAYCGATAWFRAGDNGDYTLRRVSLLLPELIEDVSKFPAQATLLYPKMFANGAKVYFSTSGAMRLWEISATGEFLERAYFTHKATDLYVSVTPQGIIGNDYVRLPDGQEVPYRAFLGKPWLAKGESELTPAGYLREFDAPAERTGKTVSGLVRAFSTEHGDLVVELIYRNASSEEYKLKGIAFEIECGGAAMYPILEAEPVAAGSEQIYTLVIPADSLDGRPEDVKLDYASYVLN